MFRAWLARGQHYPLTTLEAEVDVRMACSASHRANVIEDVRAVDYAILAAEKAQRRWANTEALAHFQFEHPNRVAGQEKATRHPFSS